MFIKKNKNKFKKLINGKSEKQVDNMFSETVSSSLWIGWFQHINKINNTDFREIIGNVLVNRNRGGISMFFAYMISYWCGYEKLNGELWDDITFNNHDNKLNFFFSRHAQIKGKKISSFKSLKNSISSNKFKITPKQRKTRITLKTIFKKPNIIYLFITLFIFSPSHK